MFVSRLSFFSSYIILHLYLHLHLSHFLQFFNFLRFFRQFLHSSGVAGVGSGVSGVGVARGVVRGAGVAGVVHGVRDEGVVVLGAVARSESVNVRLSI